MTVPGAALLFSCLGLALYSGVRLGSVAPGSTAALREAMGPPTLVEKILLPSVTAILFLGFLSSLAQ